MSASVSDLQAWLTKHADCDYGWFMHDGGFLRCHAHDDDLAAVVFTPDSLAAALESWDETDDSDGFVDYEVVATAIIRDAEVGL